MGTWTSFKELEKICKVLNTIDERKDSFVTLISPEVANHWWQMIQKVLNVYEEPIVTWWKILWFTKAIPRIAFITWLAIRDRLSTKERLASWGIKCDLMCVLCRANIENRDHLFFKCSFAQRIWKPIKMFCCIENLDDDWHKIISWAELNWKSKL